MPLEFALRPRFDLKRPVPRQRLSWLRLHPLVLPIGAYWLAAAGLTYGFIRSAGADVAEAAEQDVRSDASQATLAAPSEPPIPSPIEADTAPPTVVQPATDREPAPDSTSLAEPPRDEPRPRPDLDRASQTAPENRRPASLGAPPPSAEDEDRARVSTFEPDSRGEPAPRQTELERNAEPEQAPRREEPTASLPSCESAAATANQTIEVGSARGAPDLTRDAFASVLEHGAYLTPCSIPPRTSVEICAAVRNGSVVGVTVVTELRDATINGCVRRAVSALRFPRSPQLDVTRTRFERER